MDLFAVCSNFSPDQLDRICERATRAIVRSRSNSHNRHLVKRITIVGQQGSAEIVRLHAAGETILAIAKSLGVARCTVQDHLDRHGVERKALTPKLTDEQVLLAARRYEGGLSLASVGQGFGVDAKTI